MPPDRNQIAAILYETADLLEIRHDTRARSRAYRCAGYRMERVGTDPDGRVETAEMRSMPCIGAGMEREIAEILSTGRSELLEELRDGLPDGMAELLRVPGLGPIRIRAVHGRLGISTLEGLEGACRDGRLLGLPGFGERTQDRILTGLLQVRRDRGRILLPEGDDLADRILRVVRSVPGVESAEPVGALRRREPIVGETEILVGAGNATAAKELRDRIAANLSGEEWVGPIGEGNEQEISFDLAGGLRGLITCAAAGDYPHRLLERTGPGPHLESLSRRARDRGGKIGPGLTEHEIYASLDLPFIPPELRHDGGEIGFAGTDDFRALVGRDDLRGTFHVHTTWSDGAAPIEAMAAAAADLGLDYLGISDHSRSSRIANGLSVERLLRQIDAIDAWNRDGRAPRLLKGSEVDILADGSLDFPDEILARLDFVIGSVHSKLDMGRDQMTARVVRAMDNPYLTILGHPTERLLLTREPYPIDLFEVARQAARRGVVLELNANPRRFDVEPDVARYAADLGVLVSINPDAHTPAAIADIDYGVTQARKAWLRPDNILNCRPVGQVLAHCLQRRAGRWTGKSTV
jgi:DNA polymerase (family 10)